MSESKPHKVVAVRPAGLNAYGEDHQVLTVTGGTGKYRRKPCANCPWRTDAVGEFPAEAFRHSANTAYDMSLHKFGCHSAKKTDPATCAGFLLRGGAHKRAGIKHRQQGAEFIGVLAVEQGHGGGVDWALAEL